MSIQDIIKSLDAEEVPEQIREDIRDRLRGHTPTVNDWIVTGSKILVCITWYTKDGFCEDDYWRTSEWEFDDEGWTAVELKDI